MPYDLQPPDDPAEVPPTESEPSNSDFEETRNEKLTKRERQR
jgi:hypothetical protein